MSRCGSNRLGVSQVALDESIEPSFLPISAQLVEPNMSSVPFLGAATRGTESSNLGFS